jgi:hypothetical protein
MARNAMPPKGLSPKGRRGATAPGKGKGKSKALVPPMKGAALPPPRPVRGRVAVAVPVFPMGPPRRGMGLPPPGRGMPGRGMPPGLTTPGPPRPPMAVAAPPPPSSGAGVMQRRGAPAMMARLRRGKVAF